VYDTEHATVRSGLSVDPSASKYQPFSTEPGSARCGEFSPVWQPWVQTGSPAGEASDAIRKPR